MLLVDDVLALRRLMQITLESSGRFEVVGQAEDGMMGIEESRRLQPELVLLDMSMPEMDGLQALPRIREASPDSTVVVFSGFIEEKIGTDARQLGAAAYIEKGIDPGVLIEQLVALMSDRGSGSRQDRDPEGEGRSFA
ncbi:MAG: response regulator transcription factor [Actinomycetota bacterium]